MYYKAALLDAYVFVIVKFCWEIGLFIMFLALIFVIKSILSHFI